MRKYIWAIDLGVIVVVAVFAARATAVLLAFGLAQRTPAVSGGQQSVSASALPAVSGKQVENILERNVFCSRCPPILRGAVKRSPRPLAVEPLATKLPLKLMAIMFSPPPNDPLWSMAIVRDTAKNSAGPYRIGMQIRSATVVGILATRIYLDNAGSLEYLDLLNGQEVRAATHLLPGPPAPIADPLAVEMERAIRKTGEHTYLVKRKMVDFLLGNMAVLSRSARIVPELRDGQSADFRLFDVQPDGPFARIGLQNGDVIRSINTVKLTSPDKALEIYTKVKASSHLSVAIDRDNQRITKDYSIR